jgi:hypothetical protein
LYRFAIGDIAAARCVIMSTIAVVVILILSLLLALVLVVGARAAALQDTQAVRQSGGGEAAPHHLGDATHLTRLERAHAAQHDQEIPTLAHHSLQYLLSATHLGGGKKENTAKEKKKWTRCASWDALSRDKEAVEEYTAAAHQVLENLTLDWSGVLAELRDQVYADREWAGRINLVHGKPKIVELVPSPHAIGEGPLPKGSSAITPKELIAKLSNKPALFLFHTHPGEGAGSTMPSPTDIASSAWIAYTGEFAAELMISPYGVFMYGPASSFRRDVWAAGHTPRDAYLATLRKIVDLLSALNWKAPWTLDDLSQTLNVHGIEYIVFPTDRYAQALHRWVYAPLPSATNLEDIQGYRTEIQQLEKELGEGDTPRKKKIIKHVRFAPLPPRSTSKA